MIPFNIPTTVPDSYECVRDALTHRLAGGTYTKKCEQWLQERLCCQGVMLTASCSVALNMAAFLCGIEAGDEVILPSFTFSSAANAFAARGARLVFVDIRPDTLNIDETKIEAAITPRTKAVCVVHYAGVACEMDTVMELAHRYGLYVVEDAAHAVLASYRGKQLGTIGDFGCLSFHSTKNFTMGEGGALLIRDSDMLSKADIYYEKGTNRRAFIRGKVDKYNWSGLGESCQPCELGAACLYPQLLSSDKLQRERLSAWALYRRGLSALESSGWIRLPVVPPDCIHNGHIFYIICRSGEEREALAGWLAQNGITANTHYVPLHSAPAGARYGIFCGEDSYTTALSRRILRLPMYSGITHADQAQVVKAVCSFFDKDADEAAV